MTDQIAPTEELMELSPSQVRELAARENLAILYAGTTLHLAAGLTWQEAMQATAITACRELKAAQQLIAELLNSHVQRAMP